MDNLPTPLERVNSIVFIMLVISIVINMYMIADSYLTH